MSDDGTVTADENNYSFDLEYPQASQDDRTYGHQSSSDDYFSNPCDPSVSASLSLINTTSFRKSELGLTGWLLTPNLFTRWTPLHHLYFQLANTSLLIYFLFFFSAKCPCIGRFLAATYSTLMILWGYTVLQSIDIVAWNGAMLAICLADLLWRLCSFCCGSGAGLCRRGFGKDVGQVYRKLFQPLHVTRSQFAKVLSCKRSTRQLHQGENYAVEKTTRIDSLSLLLSGRLLVSQQGRPLHIILPHQFVDSPEYFGVSTDELFQVTITAVEESKLLVWHRDKLRLTIMSDDFLRVTFDHIIGRDVVRKLIQVSDSVSLTNGYYLSSSSKDIHHSSHHDIINGNEAEPMLTQMEEQQPEGNTALSGSFENTEIWSLTKIAEEETPV